MKGHHKTRAHIQQHIHFLRYIKIKNKIVCQLYTPLFYKQFIHLEGLPTAVLLPFS